jgi:CheY-like chemotaxis protein
MGKRLLLIDDEVNLNPAPPPNAPNGYMWYYAEALRIAGYELTEVNSTDQALEQLGTHQFDLVLLDVMMPPGKSLADEDTARGVRTGLVLADRLAQAHPKVPVVILTNVEDNAPLQALRRKPNVKKILQKTDYTPFVVVEEVNEVLGA